MRTSYLILVYFSLLISNINVSQSLNLNNSEVIDYLRLKQLSGDSLINYSFNQRPIELNEFIQRNYNLNDLYPTLLSFNRGAGIVKILPPAVQIDFNSQHPYNRNNGSMIPNRGLQNLSSIGIYFDYGPLTIQLNPEFIYAENKNYDGFWEGHYDITWARRYRLWNTIDIPERFGEKEYKQFLIGQSSIKLNFKKLSFGISNENIWWGPSLRNGIMMSNHARGFKHITFNSNRPIETKIGNFEFQIVTGRLENSGFTPPGTERTYGGQKLYIPKINQLSRTDDWRFFQGFNFSYSPSFMKGVSFGITRWVQMYSALVEGKYYWMKGNPTYFPAFKNIFRKNDSSSDLEEQTDQAAGIYFRWFMSDADLEIYSEYAYNDSKQNLRDLLLDSDHSRAVSIGMQKIFKKNNLLFNWEWTQLEQTAGRLVRNAGSWYRHYNVYHGYTNYGEVIGASIGPGSNSHYISISKIDDFNKYGIAFEVVDQDNDFFYYAFEDTNDFRRMWKDYNLHLNFQKKIGNFYSSINLIFIKSLNYQWELTEKGTSYYQPGRDVNNLHFKTKIIYKIPLN